MRKITAALLLALLLVACEDGGGGSAATTSETTSTTTAAQSEKDPYNTYLRLKPADEDTLSREDAQARAYLGCDQEWAPGTTDRALADAYRPSGICDR